MILARHYFWRFQFSKALSSRPKNHYDALGVKSNATHQEIKQAYYSLSKIYHPDTNQGNEENSFKFRQVSDAYEVLGNVKLRKLYDRGLVVGSSGTTVLREDVEEDDPTTRFYKQREKRHQVPTPLDRNTVYDFDEWARAHYTINKERKAAAREKYEHGLRISFEVNRLRRVNGLFLVGTFILCILLGIASHESYDTPLVHKKIEKKEL